MKTPTICPKCHEPLMNSVLPLRNGAESWKKVCDKKLDHSFICLTKEGKEDVIILIGMTLSYDKSIKVCWDFVRTKIVVHKGESIVVPFPGKGFLEIPWFEPNIDEYDKLIDKIKKYVTFS